MCLTTLLYPAFLESCVSPARVNLDILGEPDTTIDIVWYHHSIAFPCKITHMNIALFASLADMRIFFLTF